MVEPAGLVGRIQDALPPDALAFKRGTDAADVVSLHLLFGIQVVLDLAVFSFVTRSRTVSCARNVQREK